MADCPKEFEQLTRQLRLRMRERGVFGSVLGYALGWNHHGDPAFDSHLLRWLQLWNRLGRPLCDALPAKHA